MPAIQDTRARGVNSPQFQECNRSSFQAVSSGVHTLPQPLDYRVVEKIHVRFGLGMRRRLIFGSFKLLPSVDEAKERSHYLQ